MHLWPSQQHEVSTGNGSGERYGTIPARQSRTSFIPRFQRSECKYLITESQACQIRQNIQPFVEPDPHAAGNQYKSYQVKTLYLDDRHLKLFQETREGQQYRIKLRIRDYNTSKESPVFLEIKRRLNGLVLKSRTRLGREAVRVLLDGGAPDVSGLRGEERICYDEFTGWVGRWITQPVVWVEYTREAYVGTYNPGLRITFDRNLRCSPGTGFDENRHETQWWFFENRYIILELKFDVSFPGWMHGLVQRYDLKKISYSKYVHAVLQGKDSWLLRAT